MIKKIGSLLSSLVRNRFFPALVIVLAVAVGMLLPSAVLSVQGAHLEKADTLISTGISSGRQSSETAKLDILARFYTTVLNGSGEELQLSRGRFMTADQAESFLPEFKSILDAAGFDYTTPPDYAETEATPFLIILDDGSSMTSAIVWIVHYYWDKIELCYVLDDETGIILSGYHYSYFYIENEVGITEQPYNSFVEDDDGLLAAAQRLADALCESYGFESASAVAEIADGYRSFSITFVYDGKTVCSAALTFESDGWHFGM